MIRAIHERVGPCPECGVDFVRGLKADELFHKRIHDQSVNGLRTKLPDGFHIITHKSAMGIQRLAEWAASEARRETRHDFSAYSATKNTLDTYETTAVISVHDGRVCALLVSRVRNCEWIADLRDFTLCDDDDWRPQTVRTVRKHSRRTIDMIWVLTKYRRMGKAKQAVRVLAEHSDVAVEELAHLLPMREGAVRTWLSVGLTTIWVA